MGDIKNEAYTNENVGIISYRFIIQVTTTKLRNSFIKHLPSEYKLVTKRDKPARTEPYELYFNLLVNMTRLKNIL